MKRFIQNSILVLLPYILVAVICGLIFGSFIIFLLLAVLAFILTQLFQLYYFQRWCLDRNTTVPSLGLNRIWKNIYAALETYIDDNHKTPPPVTDELKKLIQSDYGIVLLENNKVVWFNERADSLLKFDSHRDIAVDISHLLRFPSFVDALNQRCYGQEIMLEDRQPPIAVCLLPYGERYLCMLVRDLSRFIEIKNINRELIGNVAHELRSPLTVIHGYLDILKEKSEGTKDEDLKNILDYMQTQVDRMKILANDTLDIVYLENTELQDRDQSCIDVPEMLESILESLKVGAEQYRFDTRIESFKLYGSASELHSVFYNLIDNAKCHSQSDEIKVVWQRNERGAYFEVSDRGVGIAAHHLSKLSKRFYRVDRARSRARGNTGLGLSIVKHVLDRHQATLEIESKVGEGSTFRCCFPFSRIVN